MMRGIWATAGMVSLLSLGGCLGNVIGSGEPALQGKDGSIAISKLERILDNFADREVVLVADACDAIERDSCKNATQRSLAHRLKTLNATAVFDIVTSPNPMGHVVELYVMVKLEYLVWVTEGQAVKLFGEAGGAHAKVAFEEVAREMSRIADLAMKPEAKESLDQKILLWRKRSPEAQFVSMVRFGSLPDSSGRSPLEALGSLFEVLNPLDEASQKVEDTQRMAERIFYFTKRLPQLATWHAETALDETLATPEIGAVLESLHQTSGVVDRVSKVMEKLPEIAASERKEILAAWDAREGKVDSTVKDIRATVMDAKDLASKVTEAATSGKALAVEVNEVAKSFGQVLKEVEKIGPPSPNSSQKEPSRPFNIAEYTAAAGEFTRLASQINEMLKESESLLASPAWIHRQEEVTRLAREAIGHAGERGKDWVDHLVIRLFELLVAFFILLYVYRLLTHRRAHEGKRSSSPPNPSPPLGPA